MSIVYRLSDEQYNNMCIEHDINKFIEDNLEKLVLLELVLYKLDVEIIKIPQNLTSINLYRCGIKELPHFLTTLKLEYLGCSENEITELPILPYLKYLSCFKNKLTKLSYLSENLIEIECSHNKIDELPILPKKLERFYCSNNLIKKFGDLPNTIEILYCSNNLIEELSIIELPNTLRELICSNNLMEDMPILPKNLKELKCSNNKLTELCDMDNDYPDSLTILDISKNHFIIHDDKSISSPLRRWYKKNFNKIVSINTGDQTPKPVKPMELPAIII